MKFLRLSYAIAEWRGSAILRDKNVIYVGAFYDVIFGPPSQQKMGYVRYLVTFVVLIRK